MAYKIAIASGKGGTGKTSVSVNLFRLLGESLGGRVHLVDCDVEEPNDILFFDQTEEIWKKEITQQVPVIDTEKCSFCRKCQEYCEYNAIVVMPSVNYARVNASMCHSCGACTVACHSDAISEYPEPIGQLTGFATKNNNSITEGRLEVGSAMQTMLIKALKKSITDDFDFIIYDAPPGTSCSVVETINDANMVVLVAEPTLFGLHDLKLMVELVEELEVPFGVIINKAGIGTSDIYEYLKQKQIKLIGEIPFDKEYASMYANGELSVQVPVNIENSYSVILDSLFSNIIQYEGDNYFKW